MEFLGLLLDISLIGLLLTGIHYALRLTRQLSEMRSGRAEMERFVIEFNATVNRAEAGVRGLKSAARDCGDDLEKLIEKGQLLRDELIFLTESADQIATRLSDTASHATKAAETAKKMPTAAATSQAQPRNNATSPAAAPQAKTQPQTIASTAAKLSAAVKEMRGNGGINKTPSAAERDLLRALEKLG